MNPKLLKHWGQDLPSVGLPVPRQAASSSFPAPLPEPAVASCVPPVGRLPPAPPGCAVGLQEERGRRVAYFCHAGWGLAPKAQGPAVPSCSLALSAF